MIVETHCHIISDDQMRYPRQLGPAGAAWLRNFTAEDLLREMDGAGVDSALLVQAFGAYRYDNGYVADAAARYPDRFAAVCIVDGLEPDAPRKLDYWVKELGVRGLRVVTWTEPETMLDDPRIEPLWSRASELRIPVCVLTNFYQVTRLESILRRFPDLPVALDHLGMPKLDDPPAFRKTDLLFELARFPNFYGKFSSWTIENASRGNERGCVDFFRRLIDAFGPQRLMWGSNFPASNERTYPGFVDFAQESLAFLSDQERRWMFSDSALSLWPALR